MTAVATATDVAELRTPAEIRRARYLGITYIVMAILVL